MPIKCVNRCVNGKGGFYVPVNPLLAEPMYLTGYIEKLGSGTQDIYKLCKEAGLKEPKFILDDGFRVIIWRNNREATGQVPDKYRISTGQVSGEATGGVSGGLGGEVSREVKRVVLVLNGELKKTEIQKTLDLKSDDYFRVNYINASVEAGFIQLKYPNSPNHPNQRYLLTAKGLQLKKQLTKSQKKK